MIKKSGNNNQNNVKKQNVKLSLGKITVEKDGFLLSINNGQDFYFEKNKLGVTSCLEEIENFLYTYVEGESSER